MKKVLVFAFLAALAAGAYGQQAKLVVPPFESRRSALDSAALDSVALENLQDSLINALINTGRFQVPDRNALALLAQEHRFQMSDWSDDQKSAQIGNVLNANYIIRVIASHDEEGNILMARILDVNTANALAAAEMEFTNQRDARGKMEGFVERIVQRIGEDGPIVRPPAPGTVPEGFVRVEGGTFQMGNSTGGYDDERPVHTVTVRSFYMGRHEVTQAEYEAVMGTNPSRFKGANRPVEQVSWYEAVEYCNKRSTREGLTPAYQGSGTSIICDFTASGYRLPTEAEWEYAAKGGNKDLMTYEYSGGNSAGTAGWYTDNSGGITHPVETKQPNSLGLYDMSGNVWEWCWDWYGNYGSRSQTDPAVPASGATRVERGGSWADSAAALRSSNRSSSTPGSRVNSLGFRLVRP